LKEEMDQRRSENVKEKEKRGDGSEKE